MNKRLFGFTTALLLSTSMAFSADINFDKEIFQTKLVNNSHKIKLLNSGLASFEERLQMIERAKVSIDIEYFIYNADKSGKIFTQALIKKAQEGVKIRMLLDTVMIKSQITPFYIHEFLKAGVEVKYFNNTALLNLVKGMYRNHRKLLIVDGAEVLTGGRNIGDEYFDLREDFNFLDRELHIEGDIVKSIKSTFEVFWSSKASVIVDRPKKPEQNDFKYRSSGSGKGSSNGNDFYSDLRFWKKGAATAEAFMSERNEIQVESIRAKGRELLAQAYQGTCENIAFSTEYPILNKSNREVRIIKQDLADRMINAKEKILFDSPYFIVDEDSKKTLDTAVNNNVKIELLTNGLNSTDAIYVYDVFKSIIKKWISKGLVAYTFKGEKPATYEVLDETIAKARFGVHAKTFIFDNKDVTIGTYNFDPRSANYNSEMIITCENNPDLAKEVTEDISNRMDSSFKLDTEESVDRDAFYKVSFLKRITYGILKIPANIFDYLL